MCCVQNRYSLELIFGTVSSLSLPWGLTVLRAPKSNYYIWTAHSRCPWRQLTRLTLKSGDFVKEANTLHQRLALPYNWRNAHCNTERGRQECYSISWYTSLSGKGWCAKCVEALTLSVGCQWQDDYTGHKQQVDHCVRCKKTLACHKWVDGRRLCLWIVALLPIECFKLKKHKLFFKSVTLSSLSARQMMAFHFHRNTKIKVWNRKNNSESCRSIPRIPQSIGFLENLCRLHSTAALDISEINSLHLRMSHSYAQCLSALVQNSRESNTFLCLVLHWLYCWIKFPWGFFFQSKLQRITISMSYGLWLVFMGHVSVYWCHFKHE